jgi:hypothetical protein
MSDYHTKMKRKVAVRFKNSLLGRLRGKISRNAFGAEAVFWSDIKEAVRKEVRHYTRVPKKVIKRK